MEIPCAAPHTLDEAHAILRSQAEPLASQEIPIGDAGFRVLAEAVRARVDSPREDVAAMDGFAVEDRAVQANRRDFRLVGASYPGDAAPPALGPETTVRIMTGAPMPRCKDRVIPFELTGERDGIIRIVGPVPTALHVRLKGSGFHVGQVLLDPGTQLDPPRLLVAAASDQPTMHVYKRPRLRVITSGDELAPAGAAASTDRRIPDSLTLPLQLMAKQWGADTAGAALLSDDAEAIRTAVALACLDTDVLVIAGGASHGDRDLARPALKMLGLELKFAGVAMKPGKPVWYGRLYGKHVLGLPGNPSAAMTVARLFLAPLLCALSGRGFDTALDWRELPLAASVAVADAREMFLYARRTGNHANIIPRQSASAQLPLVNAEMLVRRPAGGPALPANSLVPVLDF
ncbi:molybdopterin molybdotransferase MoeA [Agrobacterium rhizogenes]|uniref:molybdopterin molybdotransferase MoeA n=1 Tax=Rhizobium rhizogenes TaxID=359 RepID=UPI001574DA5D|nr:molybdopterin molybdotransferase MoeA [Rhizobium rhizogenes]MDJ1637964.1 molybdopterin molybdotransferase MoeA [Rhizobium rhizogenes]NTG89012.1 molybdopterin molybdotransferase MoeA [Rhizobium rhizogenes]